MTSFFWNLYARTYDIATLNFSAYQDLLVDIVKLLDESSIKWVVNLGCGTGSLESKVSERDGAFEWVGVDISKEMLRRARYKVPDDRFTFSPGDLNKRLPFKDSSRNVVVAMHSIYALEKPTKILREISRILKKGGVLILVNPLKNARLESMMHYEKEKIGSVRFCLLLLKTIPALLLNMVIAKRARDAKFHFFSSSEIRDMVEKVNLNVIQERKVYAEQSILLVGRKCNG